jgi:hypothetical protein
MGDERVDGCSTLRVPTAQKHRCAAASDVPLSLSQQLADGNSALLSCHRHCWQQWWRHQHDMLALFVGLLISISRPCKITAKPTVGDWASDDWCSDG